MQWNLGPEFIPHNGILSVEKVKSKKKKEKRKKKKRKYFFPGNGNFSVPHLL
jgi:hypothetical protein